MNLYQIEIPFFSCFFFARSNDKKNENTVEKKLDITNNSFSVALPSKFLFNLNVTQIKIFCCKQPQN